MQSHICGKPMPPRRTLVLQLRRVAYPQNVCISMWTGAANGQKAVMPATTCIELLDLSPAADDSSQRAVRELAGSIVAVTLLRPLFLLRYRAASATFSKRSGIFFSVAGTLSSPQSPKLAVMLILRFCTWNCGAATHARSFLATSSASS
jgi:hypothetical protein